MPDGVCKERSSNAKAVSRSPHIRWMRARLIARIGPSNASLDSGSKSTVVRTFLDRFLGLRARGFVIRPRVRVVFLCFVNRRFQELFRNRRARFAARFLGGTAIENVQQLVELALGHLQIVARERDRAVRIDILRLGGEERLERPQIAFGIKVHAGPQLANRECFRRAFHRPIEVFPAVV